MNLPKIGATLALNTQTVDSNVQVRSIGVYLCGEPRGNGGLNVSKTGRSDTDLNRRLKQHVGKYSAFQFEYQSTVADAFYRECELFHSYNLEGEIHPATTAGMNLRCPSGCQHR